MAEPMAEDTEISWGSLDEGITVHIFSFLHSPGGGIGWSALEVARVEGDADEEAAPPSAAARRKRRLAAAKWTAACRAVCPRWRRLAGDDALWRPLCADAFALELPEPPKAADADAAAAARREALAAAVAPLALSHGDSEGSEPAAADFFALWRGWIGLENSLGGMQLSAPQLCRASAAFRRMKTWQAAHTPSIVDSLQPPLQQEEWEAFEAQLDGRPESGLPPAGGGFAHAEQEGWQGLLALKMLLAVHNGQLTKCDVAADKTGRVQRGADDGRFDGVLGGYSAYDHIVCTRIFPLSRIITWTTRLCASPQIAGRIGGRELVFAATYDLQKIFTINVNTGIISLCTPGSPTPLLPAHPAADAPALRPQSEPPLAEHISYGTAEGQGHVLSWLENFATRLESGAYRAGHIVPDEPFRGVSIYNHDAMTTAVSRGVRAQAVAVWAGERRAHVYSVRLRLLTPEEEGGLSAEERGFTTCQLDTRHWTMHKANGEVDHVDGSGVVGNYPLLYEGGGYRNDRQSHACHLNVGVPPHMVNPGEECPDEEAFIYQSMSNDGTSFGGCLRFVPGSLQEPTGEPFDVKVEHVALDAAPEYIY